MTAHHFDLDLIAAVIRRQISVHPEMRTIEDLIRRSGLSKATVHTLASEDPSAKTLARRAKVKASTLDNLDTPLGLPVETLQMIGRHEWALLADLGVDAGLIQWAHMKASKPGETRTRLAR